MISIKSMKLTGPASRLFEIRYRCRTASTPPGRTPGAASSPGDPAFPPETRTDRSGSQGMSHAPAQPPAGSPLIGGDRALAVAQADALRADRDLAPYRIQLALEADGWHVDYELKDP